MAKSTLNTTVDKIDSAFEGAKSGEADQENFGGFPCTEPLGSVLFMSTLTRPDIRIATNVLSNFVFRPLQIHWSPAKGVLY